MPIRILCFVVHLPYWY